VRSLGVLIFISLILSTLQEGSPEVTSFELLTAGVLGVTFFWGTIEFLSSRRGIPRPLFHLLGFLVWAGVNVAIALGNDVKLLWWFRRFFPVLTLPLTALASTVAFRSQRQIRVSYITLVIIGIMFVVHALVQIRSVDLAVISNLQTLRKYGGGYYSGLGLCLTAPFLFRRPRLKRSIWLLVAGVSLVFSLGLLISFTRTYWISTTAALLVMVYLVAHVHRITVPAFLIRIIIPAMLILAILLSIMPPTIRGFVYSRAISIPQATNDLSLMDRLSELKGLWNSATQNPISILVGNGLGAKFTFYSPNPWSWGGRGWIENDYSHNYYAYIFWSTGLIGLSLFLLFWGSILRQASKILKPSSDVPPGLSYYLIGVSTAVLNLLIASLTAPPLMSFKWAVYFGVLVGLALRIIRIQLNQSPNPKGAL